MNRTNTKVIHLTEQQRALAVLALAQGIFYLLTGIWPLVNLRSFMKVTGPKVDGWLVKTAGVLISVIGAVLCMAGLRRQLTPEIPMLAVGSAAGLAGIDVVYVMKRRISPIYLLDAVVEIGLCIAWAFVWWQKAASQNQPAATATSYEAS